jgi:putative endonuclease
MNNVLYTGVTNNLVRRVYEHKEKMIDGFTKRYNLTKLVYFAELPDIREAIAFEKKIKAGSRKKKDSLIRQINPEWKDLLEE